MTNFFESLKDHVNDERTAKAARLLGENSTNTTSAVDSIFASLMGVLTRDGKDIQIQNIFNEAGKLDILSNVNALFEDKQTKDQQNIGDNLLQTLLGDRAADFTQGITQKTGISTVAANRLISMLAPIFAGYFGKKLYKKDWTAMHLRNEIISQRDTFAKYIPKSIMDKFGLAPVLTNEVEDMRDEGIKKKNYNWLLWLFIILLLILMLLWWKSCRDRDADVLDRDNLTIVDADRDSTRYDRNRDNNYSGTDNTYYDLDLPNGRRINVLRGGMEEKMIDFLNSNDYKNATENQLKDKWFEFENINFVFGSATELTGDSEKQLDNIAEILKDYSGAKIKIGANADKVGSEETNMDISRQRAKTIERMLINKGLKSQVVATEGYGEQYATKSENASDSERAVDRDIALRFVK